MQSVLLWRRSALSFVQIRDRRRERGFAHTSVRASGARARVSVTGVEQVTARFRALPQYVRAKLRDGMTAIGYSFAGTVVSTKLHGQVLHQRSGNLATAVAGGVQTTDTDTSVTTKVGVLRGPALAYAGIHEYGGDIHRIGRKKGAYVIHMPERSYLRSTLAEQRDAILSKISRVVAEAQSGG